MSCDVGCRHGSDPVLLWLWCSPAATAPIRLLAWEPPYVSGVALKRTKGKKKKKKRNLEVNVEIILNLVGFLFVWTSICHGCGPRKGKKKKNVVFLWGVLWNLLECHCTWLWTYIFNFKSHFSSLSPYLRILRLIVHSHSLVLTNQDCDMIQWLVLFNPPLAGKRLLSPQASAGVTARPLSNHVAECESLCSFLVS